MPLGMGPEAIWELAKLAIAAARRGFGDKPDAQTAEFIHHVQRASEAAERSMRSLEEQQARTAQQLDTANREIARLSESLRHTEQQRTAQEQALRESEQRYHGWRAATTVWLVVLAGVEAATLILVALLYSRR